MLPSRGTLRSLSAGRAALQSQLVKAPVRDFPPQGQTARAYGHGRRFGTSSRGISASTFGKSLAGTKLPGVSGSANALFIGTALSSRRGFSLWTRSPKSEPATPEPSASTAPVTPQTPDTNASASASASVSSSPSSSPSPTSNPTAESTPAAPVESTTPPSPVETPDLDVLSNTSLLDIPERIGYLKELGLDYGWGPTSMMQWILEHVHIYTGLPWWGSILTTSVLVRIALFKPTLTAQQATAKLQAVSSTPEYKAAKDRMTAAAAAGNTTEMMEARQVVTLLNKRGGVNVFASLWSFLQIPVGYGAFRILNGMGKLPVPGFEDGGFLWFTDLGVSDPFFILPLGTSLMMLATLRAGSKFAPPQTQAQMKLMAFILVPMSAVLTSWLPAAVQWYFLTTTTLGYGQNVIFQNPAFRRLAGLPPLVLNRGAVHGNPFATSATAIPTTATTATTATTTAAAEPQSKEGGNVLKDALAQVRQTVHAAKGRSGNYIEEAKKEQEKKNLESWNEKRAEEQRRKFKAELNRKR
ncbi:hypothetical protein SODALDRAFT_350294 [Sodiomyces alkalinus F11]|uniref:Membrane insertase YidC/Oxa/ALB C-terminal domain-containing protein n=1 Tax=Sodiomyces alkalinus (strain CBS 110278 / VKM F-3762 / F11) TaxID=1314773 RepID=A0A3N2PX32_SODAK|nr:hypothetical protein SODALDRAFT_350294 [Sodiomyces alkalinus F11]ROT39038.1 hypothetical protein SODALDRAFT_350294 [Sodiomyces alkalinus F11]